MDLSCNLSKNPNPKSEPEPSPSSQQDPNLTFPSPNRWMIYQIREAMGISSSNRRNPSPQTPQNKQIFILAGQSNMSGRGGVTKRHRWDGVVPPECRPNPDSIHRLAADLRWESAEEPLHADIDSGKVCGVGPGMAFANAVAEEASGVVVALVPCAVGGTAIRRWGRGQRLYENMVRRARESLKGGGEIRALLWFQGESDTSSLRDAVNYKEKMEKLIVNVREDLGLPSLPIIQVVIATGEGKYIDKVREAQVGINLPNVVSVDAKGLQVKEDHLHLTTEAQVKLGQLLANAYLSHFATPQQSFWLMQVLGFGRQILSTLFPL